MNMNNIMSICKTGFIAGAIKTLPFVLLAGPLPLYAADGGTVQVNQSGYFRHEYGYGHYLYLCMIDAAYPSKNCMYNNMSPPEAAGVVIWTDKSNCWSLSMDVSGTAQTTQQGKTQTHDFVKRANYTKWTLSPGIDGQVPGTSISWRVNATGHYRWTALCPGNTAPPSGSVRFVLMQYSGGGDRTWDYPLYDKDSPGPVIPPTPEASCTASKTNLDLAHDTIAVNKVFTTAPEAVTITCSNKTRPAITVNGVAIRANEQTIVPVDDNDKATSTLDVNEASYTQAVNGVTVVAVSSTVKLKQAGQYDRVVPLVFSIP